MKLRVLIVDDDPSVLQPFVAAVEAAEDMQVVGQAATLAAGLHLLRNTRPDVLLVDLGLPDGDGIDVLREMAEAKFAGAVIVISGMDGKRRSAARSFARSVGIELQSLPKPLDLAALRISLANLGKTAMGLPAIHTWGGVASDAIVERHRA